MSTPQVVSQTLRLSTVSRKKTATGSPRSPLATCQLAGATMLTALFLIPFAAGAFDSGSTGAYGPMNITNTTTLDLPPDGIFNCTTITVAQGATLTFNRNGLNTPVYLLATGDVLVEGAIDVSGKGSSNSSTPGPGGPGGFDGGNGGAFYSGQVQGGAGQGPGGGTNHSQYPQSAAFGTGGQGSTPNSNIYGNLLLTPLIGGSGGAGTDGNPGTGGGGGGGALLIAASTRLTVSGCVYARGASGYPGNGSGSGGAIRLIAPIVGGGGTLNALGDSGGGQGRIRIDCTDNQAYLTLSVQGVGSRGSRMFVFPTIIPALDIIQVGGQAIPAGTNNAVVVELAVGASTNQTVKIQARNFTNDVPIRVVITPEHGPSGAYDAVILQSSGNPPNVTVPVIIPAGSACQVNAWTR